MNELAPDNYRLVTKLLEQGATIARLEAELATLKIHLDDDVLPLLDKAQAERDGAHERMRELEDIAGELGAAHDDVVHVDQNEYEWMKNQLQKVKKGTIMPSTGIPGDSMLGARESAEGVLSREIGDLQLQLRDREALLRMLRCYGEVGGITPEDMHAAECAMWRLLMERVPSPRLR